MLDDLRCFRCLMATVSTDADLVNMCSTCGNVTYAGTITEENYEEVQALCMRRMRAHYLAA